MKLIKKVSSVVFIMIGIGILVAMDMADRDIIYSQHIPENEFKEFHYHNSIAEVQEAYERNYENPYYKFPRGDVEKVKIYKNQFLTSRITSKTLSKEDAILMVELLNNPENFDWDETTWKLNESEYILRFFDKGENEIGKVWLCVENCGMTKSIPFSPSMKFGGLSKTGRRNLDNLLKRINEN